MSGNNHVKHLKLNLITPIEANSTPTSGHSDFWDATYRELRIRRKDNNKVSIS